MFMYKFAKQLSRRNDYKVLINERSESSTSTLPALVCVRVCVCVPRNFKAIDLNLEGRRFRHPEFAENIVFDL